MNKSMLQHSHPGQRMPQEIGVLHFVGIGGIGMSGIAEILHNLGYTVSGSDIAANANVERLRGLGITIHIGHKEENVDGVAVVVKSTAVPWTNPEITAARAQNIPVVRRSEMLAELTRLKATIAVAGTHGKTTTTSLVGMLFESAGMGPTVINGGIINAYGTNAHLGDGEWLIAEADESDGTFIKIPATIGVITNIDPEHLDFYGSFDALRAAFRTFLENLPFYGLAVLCHDHSEVRTLAEEIKDRRVLTYGIDGGADVQAVNIRHDVTGSTFDVQLSERVMGEEKTLTDIFLPIPGVHNVQNSLAALAIGLELKFPENTLVEGFQAFSGVKRRFTKAGEVEGITIIDDYGHHPTEVAASLATARAVVQGKGRVIAVLQPHRYTRLEALFDQFCTCFSDADSVIISPVYAAGEDPIERVNEHVLVDMLNKNGADAHTLADEEQLPNMIQEFAQPGDLVICLGAGSITQWANALPEQLTALYKTKAAS